MPPVKGVTPAIKFGLPLVKEERPVVGGVMSEVNGSIAGDPERSNATRTAGTGRLGVDRDQAGPWPMRSTPHTKEKTIDPSGVVR